MFLLSLTAPHLNLSIMCVSSVEFHLESEIIFCQYSCIQTMLNLIPCCLAKESFNMATGCIDISNYICLGKWMLQSPLSQQSRKLCLVKLNLNYHGLCRKMTKSFSEYSSVISIASSCDDDLAYVWHLKYIIML